MKRMLIVLVLMITACGHAIDIYKGGKVQIVFTPSPDADVVKYRLYATCSDSTTSQTEITSWNIANADQTNNVILDVPVVLGGGYFYMTAIDAAGNESLKSNKAVFTVVDPRPGAPYIIELRIL